MWAFSEAEKYLRVNSYITGWEIGKTKGLKGPELAKFAEDLSWETQFDQSKANRPRIQQNWAGRTALLYRNYLGNQIRYLKNRAKTPEGRKAVGTYVAIQLSLGGVMGLIGVREVRNIARAFGVDVEDEFRQLLGKDKQTEAELVLYGAPTLANTNLSGMIGSGEFVPGATQGVYEAVGRTLAGPAIDLPAKAVKALQVYSQTGSELAAAKTAAPRFARNLLKAYEGATTGAIRDGSLEPQLHLES
jgi:hypothetical protein